MATVNFIPESNQSISAMKAVINYCLQQKKVADEESGRRLVSGVNCNGENSFTEFMVTKNAHKKKSGITFYHYVQSFSPRENDYAEQLARNEKPASDIPIFDYMCAHYRKIEKNIQKSTAESYHGMIYGRIRRYFTARNNLTVGNITSTDIEDFYEWMFESGVVANTVIHYHTVLHSAFKRAFKDGLIDANPFDRIDRPKKK